MQVIANVQLPGLVTQLDDLSPFHWDLCIDHLYFQHAENTGIYCSYVLQLPLLGQRRSQREAVHLSRGLGALE